MSITAEDGGSRVLVFILFIYFFKMRPRKEEEREKKSGKNDQNALPPTELYLSNGPLSGGTN